MSKSVSKSKSYLNQVHYIRIPVRDSDQSVKWYTEILGLELLTITEESYAVLKMNEGLMLLVLVPTEDDTYAHFSVKDESAFSIGFTSPLLKEFHQYLIENDVKVDEITEDHGHYYFHFYDPSGNKLQVHW